MIQKASAVLFPAYIPPLQPHFSGSYKGGLLSNNTEISSERCKRGTQFFTDLEANQRYGRREVSETGRLHILWLYIDRPDWSHNT